MSGIRYFVIDREIVGRVEEIKRLQGKRRKRKKIVPPHWRVRRKSKNIACQIS